MGDDVYCCVGGEGSRCQAGTRVATATTRARPPAHLVCTKRRRNGQQGKGTQRPTLHFSHVVVFLQQVHSSPQVQPPVGAKHGVCKNNSCRTKRRQCRAILACLAAHQPPHPGPSQQPHPAGTCSRPTGRWGEVCGGFGKGWGCHTGTPTEAATTCTRPLAQLKGAG